MLCPAARGPRNHRAAPAVLVRHYLSDAGTRRLDYVAGILRSRAAAAWNS